MIASAHSEMPHQSADKAIALSALPLLGLLISGLLIGCGLVFRTYAITMATPLMEAARQLGVPFILAELCVIGWASRNGFGLFDFWKSLPAYGQWLMGLFLSSFWVGSVFVSELKEIAILHNLFLLIHLVFACAVAHLAGRFSRDDQDKMAAFIIGGMAVFAIMIAQAFIFHPPLNFLPGTEIWQFAVPGFISVRLFGAFCGAMFCLMMGIFLLAEEQKRLTVWHWLWISVPAAMMVWTGTRAAVAGSLAALFMAVILYRIRPSLRVALGIVGALAVATLIAIALLPYGDPVFYLYYPGDGASAAAASGGRFVYWPAVWHAYLTVPVFGAGPYAPYYILDAAQPMHVQPHNIFLQFLISWGGPATLLALSMMAIVTVKAHLIAWKHRMVLPFLMMLDCLLLMSLLDGTTHFAQPVMLIMISYGAIFGYSHAAERGDPQPQVA
jgi:exopolysaccharide production protein ExoQ